MLKQLSIKNLRGITDLVMDDLGQVNLFVGANNSGKTTVLEALFYLLGAPNPALPLVTNALRGMRLLSDELLATFFHDMNAGDPVTIAGRFENDGRACDGELKISLVKREREIEPVAPEGGVVPRKRNGSSVMEKEVGLELVHVEDNARRSARVYLKDGKIEPEGDTEPLRRVVFLSPMGDSEWKSRFAKIQSRKRVPEVIQHLQKIDPSITDLRLNDAGLVEADIGLEKLIPVNLMGGGLVRFFSIVLTLYDLEGDVLLVDEIETGLHHSSQQELWNAVFDLAHTMNVQVFATTHSYECIQAFAGSSTTRGLFGEQARVFRIERKDGKCRATSYTPDVLAESVASHWEVR